MMAVLLHIYTMQWCYVDREKLGASTTLFFSLLSRLCCWSSDVFDTWAWVLVLFSLFLFILCRWNEKKRRKKENRKKQMSPCYVERFARQWSLIDVSRFSYFVSLNLCIIIIIIISIYLLKFPLLFLLFFVRMTSRSHWSSTPIAIGSDYCLYTSSNTNSSYFCCCQYNGKRKTLSTFLSIFLIVWL